MGLDGVELIVEVEKTFDIEISDSEAENISTVGDFYETVWIKIKGKENKKCSTAMMFYRFRRLLSGKIDFRYKEFKPDANLNNLIPKDFRKNKWNELQQEFDFQLPDLELPTKIRFILNFIGWTIVLGTLVYAILAVNFHDASKWLFLWPVSGIILMIIISYVLRPLRTDIGQETIREFIETVVRINYKKIRLHFGANRTEMEKIINDLIHDKIGVDYNEIKPEASLVNDLGIN